MSKSNVCERGLLQLVFQNIDTGFWLLLGNSVTESLTDGTLSVALHTASPGPSGTQLTNEATYSPYGRVLVQRSSLQWSVTESTGVWTVSNVNPITFAANGGASETIRFVSIGTGTNDEILVYAPIATGASRPCTVDAADVTANTITLPGHGFVADDQVMFKEVPGDALPGSITADTFYYVRSAPGTDSFAISTSAGDVGPVTITSAGSGRCVPVTEVPVLGGDTPEISAGQFQYTTD